MRNVVALVLAGGVLAGVISILPASAQTIIDGSGKVLTAEQRGALVEALGDELADPVSAQIRRLKPAKLKIEFCGEVNAKNALGAYVGFRPFKVLIFGKQASLRMMPVEPGYKEIFLDDLRARGC